MLPLSKFVIAGFSQGSMLALDVSLRLPQSPYACIIMSGILINRDEYVKLAGKRKELKIVQSHGTSDFVLPFVGATALRDVLIKSGVNVEFIQFNGAHQVPLELMQRFRTLVQDI